MININIALAYDPDRSTWNAATDRYGGVSRDDEKPEEALGNLVSAIREAIVDGRSEGDELDGLLADREVMDGIRYNRALDLLRRGLEAHYPGYAALPNNRFGDRPCPLMVIPEMGYDYLAPDAPEDMRWAFEMEATLEGHEALAADLWENGREGEIWSRYLKWQLDYKLENGLLKDLFMEVFELWGTEYDVPGRDVCRIEFTLVEEGEDDEN